jgi:hypothetical protein
MQKTLELTDKTSDYYKHKHHSNFSFKALTIFWIGSKIY